MHLQYMYIPALCISYCGRGKCSLSPIFVDSERAPRASCEAMLMPMSELFVVTRPPSAIEMTRHIVSVLYV